ncbi:hypothetical protein [Actinophytocola gossypii]|uniref:DUF3558 domain-containing protein n=1 Tax=Actinophytocola gossypii TaxID=2812003 RepID=A0ABT2JI09_9PSEU|nr:hypothetical protein [Actinophytocola gossypii]MCT2587528.1 hypothetical protein [Actinophytocola gossypii]
MRVLGVLLVMAVVVTGCTATAVDEPDTSERDRDAVVSALRAINPCTLLPGQGELRWSSPYRCFTVEAPRIVVVVGKWLDPARSSGSAERFELDGAAALRRPFARNCVVDLPVGADLYVRFDAQGTGLAGPLCEAATRAARTGVRLLANPDVVAMSGPRQDACDLLERAAGDRLEGLEPRFAEAGAHGLDLCQARRVNDSGWESAYSVRIVHGTAGALSNERAETLDGRPVAVYETDDCEYGWRAGDSGAPEPLGDRILRTRAPDCATAAELARTLMATDTDPSPSVDPQRPVTTPF